MPARTQCPICAQAAHALVVRDRVQYFECEGCSSLFAEPEFLRQVEQGRIHNYQEAYWHDELKAARERSYGSSLARVAEVFFYARRPITRFVDIGTGPGYLLDALQELMPELSDIFYGVELCPPPVEYRSKHANYVIGMLGGLDGQFDGGICIEVIEHLTPMQLRGLARQIADKSAPGACYYIGSGQPEYVKKEDPAYLDPHHRGHVVSYSIEALRRIFSAAGMSVTPLYGRTWAVLIEKEVPPAVNAEQLENRLWTADKRNMESLGRAKFGAMFMNMGLESARCYSNVALVELRTQWALSLQCSL